MAVSHSLSAVSGSVESASDPGVLVERHDWYATITMNRPQRRNALSLQQLTELIDAFEMVADSDALGVVLAGNGPVFSAGHDFADVVRAEPTELRQLLATCTRLMQTIAEVPQVVVARVHGLATAAGCQLVASCDLAVTGQSAGFAAPGGKGGWFCHTPMVAIGRDIGRKRAMEMALTGDTIDAATALEWGLVNRVVPDDQLDSGTVELLERATRGSAASKAWGKQTLHRQLGLPLPQAYDLAMEAMVAAAALPDAREGMTAFMEKRQPRWQTGR